MNAHVINITPPTDAERAAIAKLSPRQREVMIGLALGRTCRELADELSISVKTIDTHRGYDWMAAAPRSDAVPWSRRDKATCKKCLAGVRKALAAIPSVTP